MYTYMIGLNKGHSSLIDIQGPICSVVCATNIVDGKQPQIPNVLTLTIDHILAKQTESHHVYHRGHNLRPILC